MALSRAKVTEILSKVGVDAEHMAEAVSEICAGNAASVEYFKEQIGTLEEQIKGKDSEIGKLAGVTKELEELKAKVAEDAKAREGKDYDKLKAEYDEYKSGIEKRDARAAKEKAFREVLKDAEIDKKYFDKIIKYSDIDGCELDDEGKLKDASERIKAVKKEWPEYHVEVQQQGAQTATPPANNGGSMSKEDILKIEDASERQDAIAKNHELFGF